MSQTDKKNSDKDQRVAQLSDAKRALLEKRLAGRKSTGRKNTGTAQDSPSPTAPRVIPHKPADRPALASFAQERLWYLHQINPASPAYNMHGSVRLHGSLDVDILKQSLNSVITRHEILRTTFTLQNTELVQIITPTLTIDLPVTRLSSLAAPEREIAALELAIEDGQARFDLEKGPLLRASLLQLDQQDHILLLTIHHIVTDEWSMQIFWREVTAYYRAAQLKQDPSLADLQIQYADYGHWQRERLQNEELAAERAYWHQQLVGELPTLQLPTGSLQTEVQSTEGKLTTRGIPHTLQEALRALGQQHGATLFMSLLTAFNVLLYRYTNQTDLLIGTPVAQRDRPEIQAMIGFCLNTIVLRTQVEQDAHPTFLDLLQQVRDTTLDAYANQEYPFQKLVEELAPTRDQRINPLFQVMFVLQQEQLDPDALPNLTRAPYRFDAGVSKFDLTLFVNESAQTPTIAIEYDSSLFSNTHIEHMLCHYEQLLNAIIANPAQPISHLRLLTDNELELVTNKWNDTAKTLPTKPFIHTFIEQNAQTNPNAVAVVYNDETLTYDQLNQRADQLAESLRASGTGSNQNGPNQFVGLYLERSIEMIVAIVGVLKAGGAYLPLDPAYPSDRLAFMLDETAAPLLLSQTKFADEISRVTGFAKQSVVSNLQILQKREPETTNGRATLPPENFAYILYTSGSTGTPKGVPITHQNLVHSTSARIDFYDTPVHTFLLLSSFSFDSSLVGIFWTLCQGGTLVLPQPGEENDLHKLAQLIERHRVTHTLGLPSLYRLLLQYAPHHTLNTLETVIVAGETCPPALVHEHFAKLPHARFYNEYGPTEATVWCSAHEMQPPSQSRHVSSQLSAAAPERLIPIGRPPANTRLYILDPRGQLLPVGIAGELFVGGAGVARGYFDRPLLSQEKFVEIPIGNRHERLYRTGDLARYRADGAIEFLGRLDSQVKIRGHRIELEEIEALLSQHGQVDEAVVIAQIAEQQLIAYVTCAQKEQIETSVLRVYLGERLPAYMLPTAIIHLDEMPRTPNGKIDRNALPTPQAKHLAPPNQYVAPQSEIELTLAAIWADVLAVDQVGIHDNFFELGGHSLRAIQSISRLRQQHNIALGIQDIFDSPTIAELATRIDDSTAQGAQIGDENQQAPLHEIVPQRVQPSAQKSTHPMSAAQRRIWFLNELESDLASYKIPIAIRLFGPLETTILQRSLQAIIERHAILRTTFQVENGVPVQVIHPTLLLDLPVHDLSEYTYPKLSEANKEIQKRLRADANQPFDLKQGPLCRASLFKVADDEHVFLFNVHHIVFDGWSLGVFFQELEAHYHAFLHDQSAELPALPIQYVDFAYWQNERFDSAEMTRELTYWTKQLAGAPPLLSLPTDFPRPPQQQYTGATFQARLPQELVAKLEQLSQQENVSLYMTLLAGFKTLLHRYANQDDIIVGSPIAGRTTAETESLIGMFVNTLILRSSFADDPTFQELLHQVARTAVHAFEHQELPVEQLIEAIQPIRSQAYSPLFQVMFALQNVPQHVPQQFADLQVVEERTAHDSSIIDLSVYATQTDAGLDLWLEYNTSLFTAESIQRMVHHFETLLHEIVRDPLQPVSTVPLLQAAQQTQLLVDWNKTTASYPDAPLHELFDAQAQKTPAAIAAIFPNNSATLDSSKTTQLTYAKLQADADLLADYLRGQGVGRGTLVGLCAERSPHMLISILAILKAGAAYVPLDPSHPPDRLAFMIADTELPLLLTQQDLLDKLPAHNARVICVDREWEQIVDAQANLPTTISTGEISTGEINVSADDPAYIIYTSGSTGQPKGVVGLHGATVNRCAWMWETYAFGANEICCQKTNLGFVDSIWEIFGPLLRGIPTVYVPDELILEPTKLIELLAAQKVTRLVLVPALLTALLDHDPDLAQRLPDLRYWISSGETLSVDLAKRFQQQMPQRTLINLYGSSEVAADVTYYEVKAEEAGASVPIGRPIANAQIYLLDAAAQPVPIGVPGEIYVGGAALAGGYLNRSDLTAERFVEVILNSSAHRLYRTGDLGRYRADGLIEYLGRRDHQVQLRGFRIELGEIESVLAEHADVSAAAVTINQAAPNSQRLIAYIACQTQQHPSTDALRTYLSHKLPDYMIPSLFVLLEELPQTPSGKLDRNALPDPNLAEVSEQNQYKEPSDELETQLVEIWQEVLAVEQVGVDDNFFALGGHSLLAVQLFARVEECITHKPLPLALLFQAPTVAKLAAAIREESTDAAWSLVVPLETEELETEGDKPPLFCIHGAGGNVLLYRELARHFAESQQPVYGIQCQGLDGKQPILRTVEEMAAVYVDEIQSVQPAGPYLLLGYCLGGTIAFEIAQRLVERGETVAFVGLIETYNWARLKAPTQREKVRYQFQRAEFIVRNFMLLDGAQKWGFMRTKLARIRNRTEVWRGMISRLGSNRNSSNPTTRDNESINIRLAEIWQVNDQAIATYQPQAYAGSVTQFVPMKDYASFSDPQLGWDEVVRGGVRVERLPVYPAGMIYDPFAEELARRVQHYIEMGLDADPRD